MAKKYTILISNERVIEKLDSLPQRSKGAYISQVLDEKISHELGIKQDEEAIRKIVRNELLALADKGKI